MQTKAREDSPVRTQTYITQPVKTATSTTTRPALHASHTTDLAATAAEYSMNIRQIGIRDFFSSEKYLLFLQWAWMMVPQTQNLLFFLVSGGGHCRYLSTRERTRLALGFQPTATLH